MKKIVSLLLCCLLLCGAAMAEVPAELPKGAINALQGRLADGYQISESCYSAGEERAAVILSREGRNRLVILRKEGNAWRIVLNSVDAVRQGAQVPDIVPNGTSSIFLIYDNPDGTMDSYTYYTQDEKTWWLSQYRLGQGGANFRTFRTEEGVIRYSYTENGVAGNFHNVYGTYQREVKYLSLDALPTSLQELRQTLSQPPKIPEGGLTAQEVRFTSGKKYPVYSGPGEDYLRPSNGKAAVSTNDWIQVFGTEGDWALIQYDISSKHMRFGYIAASALPKNAQVPELDFQPVDAYLTRYMTLTDDPLNTLWALTTLPEGSWVTWLATMGEWAYVESTTGDAMRGFVPVDALSTHRVFDLASHRWNEQAAALGGTMTVREDGMVLLLVDEWQLRDGQEPARFEAYNEETMQLIFRAERDTSGFYRGSGLLENGWSVLICPVYGADSADLAAGLSVQW